MQNNFHACWLKRYAFTRAIDSSSAVSSAVSSVPFAQNCAQQFAQPFARPFARPFAPSTPAETARWEAQATCSELSLASSIHIAVTEGAGDSFTIEKNADGYRIIGGETGVLYGVYRLNALLRQGAAKCSTSTSTSTSAFTLKEKPAFTYRILNHWDNVDGTIERGYAGRSLFFDDGNVCYNPERIIHYARLLASVGINAISINNVNVHQAAISLLTTEQLPAVKSMADLFRPFGIRLILAVNYASPVMLGELSAADPADERVKAWWRQRMTLLYSYVPDLLGVIVKADSENQPGPYAYGADHADGANLLADAMAPHGGWVFWRCFVYNCKQDWRDRHTDRPKAAYDTYRPLDGKFKSNVVLQIKHGPFDFQVREPVSPLLGAMNNTAQALEFQLTQEYTGHQIDLYFLPEVWKEVFDFDTALRPRGRIVDFAGEGIDAVAAVSNVGNDANWTGHDLAQANLYAYGRMIWDPTLTPEALADEWCALMFPGTGRGRDTVKQMLLSSRRIYERYTTPLGMGWFVKPHIHYGPDPLGYEFSQWGTYHRADSTAVGIDRSIRGTGYTAQYAETVAQRFDDPHTCPEDLLLFFHRVRYDHIMKNGMTLLQFLYDAHFTGAEEAAALLAAWRDIEDELKCKPEEELKCKPEGKLKTDPENNESEAMYNNVLQRLIRQVENAAEWRDVFNTFFYRLSGLADAQGRVIYK